MTPSTPVSVVLFDAVGTLIHPDPPVAQAYANWGRRFGSQLDTDQVRQRFTTVYQQWPTEGPIDEAGERRRWRQVVRAVLDDVAHDRAEALFDALWHHFSLAKHWRLTRGVADVWRQLSSESELRIGIASNFDGRLRNICRNLSPLDRCEFLFCSAEIGHAKPSHAFYTEVTRRLNVSPGEVLMVGDDRQRDFHAPRQFGWQALLLDSAADASTADTIRELSELPPRITGAERVADAPEVSGA